MKIWSLFCCLFFGANTASYAFVSRLALLENAEGKKILLIGDRHIELSNIDPDLLKKELSDIQSVKTFIDTLVSKKIKHGWILENCKESFPAPPAESIRKEMLYAIPKYVEEKKQRPYITSIFSDCRREGIKDFSLASGQYLSLILQDSLTKLNELNLWSKDDLRWLNSQTVIHPHDLIPHVEKYWQSSPRFKRSIESSITGLAQNVARLEKDLGRFNNIQEVEKRLTTLEKEVEIAVKTLSEEEKTTLLEKTQHSLSECHLAIDEFKIKFEINNKASLSGAVFKKTKQLKSFETLTNLSKDKLCECISIWIADIGFLIDVIRNQQKQGLSIGFFGGRHAAKMIPELERLGYNLVFSEGDMSFESIGIMNQWDENDHPLSKNLLKERFEQTLSSFGETSFKQDL